MNLKAASAQPIDEKSEKENSEDCEIIEMEEKEAPRRIVAPKTGATDQMVANFLNVTTTDRGWTMKVAMSAGGFTGFVFCNGLPATLRLVGKF